MGFGPTREFLFSLCRRRYSPAVPRLRSLLNLLSSPILHLPRRRSKRSRPYPRRLQFAISPSIPRRLVKMPSPLHQGADLFRSSSAEERRIEIGRDAAARLSAQAAKRLSKMGLPAVRVPRDSDMPLYDNALLVTGRLNQVDEGNRFTRIALGLGAGESRLTTEVHVFRVMHGERAEVLSFTTMPTAERCRESYPRWEPESSCWDQST